MLRKNAVFHNLFIWKVQSYIFHVLSTAQVFGMETHFETHTKFQMLFFFFSLTGLSSTEVSKAGYNTWTTGRENVELSKKMLKMKKQGGWTTQKQ